MSKSAKQPHTLQQELAFFSKHKEEYLKTYPGQFVLISGDSFLGSFTTEKQAYEAGLQKVGIKPFLIKQVLEDDGRASIPAYTLGLLSA